jgi:hypothetical protein
MRVPAHLWTKLRLKQCARHGLRDKILGAAKLGDLPVELATKLELVINRKGARPHRAALTVARAAEVIE